jgi:dTMP kinase
VFFSIDGGDGSGKSTQVALFCEWLRQQGRDVIACRDPGSTPLGESVRQIVLHSQGVRIGRRSEMLLYMAARAQMTEEVIRPALAAGKAVVSDRYLLANVVYQGYGGGLDVDELWQVGLVATGGLLPNLTIVLDLPADKAAARIRRPLDRMEQQGDAFHARVRQGFLSEAARRPDRVALVSADDTVERVQDEIRRLAAARMGR